MTIPQKFIKRIIQLELDIMSDSLSLTGLSHAVIQIDNFKKALIDVYGKDGYEKMREEANK